MPFLVAPIWQNNPQSSLDFFQKKNEPVFSVENGFNPILNPKQKSAELFFMKFNNSIFETNIFETDNAISTENKINSKRLLELEQKFSKQFISHILEDDFEYGIDSKAHTMVKSQMKINSIVTKEWLNKIYVANIENPEILIGILRVIARFDKDEISPIGYTIAGFSLNHKEEVVQETAIRTFESWGGYSSLKILENITVSTKWIKEYLDGVIADLKSEYVGKKN